MNKLKIEDIIKKKEKY